MPDLAPPAAASPREPTVLRNALDHLPGLLLLVGLPLTMTVANKSAPLILALAAATANIAAWAGGRSAFLRQRYGQLLRTGTAAAVAIVCAMAIASLGWSIDPAATARGLVEGLPEVAAGLALGAAWPLVAPGNTAALLRIGLLAAVAAILVEAYAGMPMHHLVDARAEDYDLKRSAAPLAILLWPALDGCVSRGRAVVLVLAVLLAAAAAHASASVVAVVVSCAIFGFACVRPRWALSCVLGAGLAMLAAAPFGGTVMRSLLPQGARALLSRQHADIRLDLWSNFERHVPERWLWGHGFNASQAVSESPLLDHARDIAMTWNVHPHDVLLQIWVEFGLVGALGAAVSFVYWMLRLDRLNDRERSTRLGFIGAVASVALVGNSAWAPWWLASCAACLATFHLLRLGSPVTLAPDAGAELTRLREGGRGAPVDRHPAREAQTGQPAELSPTRDRLA